MWADIQRVDLTRVFLYLYVLKRFSGGARSDLA